MLVGTTHSVQAMDRSGSGERKIWRMSEDNPRLRDMEFVRKRIGCSNDLSEV